MRTNNIWFIFVIALGLSARADRLTTVVDPNLPSYHDALLKKFGPVVSETSRPAAHRLLSSLLRSFAKGLQKLESGGSTHLIYPYLFESEKDTAEAMVKSHGKVNSHLIALSTQFIESLTSAEKSPEGYSQSYYNLAGTLAFVLAVDLISTENPDMSEREVRLRAAVKGTELATASGLPGDIVYKMLEWLRRNQADQKTIIGLLFDREPQLDLQLAAVRSYLVSKSFHLGEPIKPSGLVSDVRMLKDLADEVAAKKDDVKWTFTAPHSLKEAADRIANLYEHKSMTETYKAIEFHRLLTFAMDTANETFRRNGTLGDDLKTYRALAEFMLNNVSAMRFNNSISGTYISDLPVEGLKIDWPQTRYGRSWERYLREAEFFQSAEYQTMISELMAAKYKFVNSDKEMGNIPDSQKWSYYLTYFASGVFLPETAIVSSGDMGSWAFKEFARASRSDGIGGLPMALNLALDSTSMAVQFEVTAELQKQVLSKLSLTDRLRLHTQDAYLDYLPLPVHSARSPDLEHKRHLQRTWDGLNRRAKKGEAHAQDVVSSYMAMIDTYWNNRAHFALAELASGEKAYWDWIGQLKGLNHDQTMTAIRQSVRELLESDPNVAPPGTTGSYMDLLQALKGKKYSYMLEKDHVPWLDPAIRPLIKAKLAPNSEELNTASTVIDGTLISFDPELVKGEYSENAAKNIQIRGARAINYSLILEWHKLALTEAFGPAFASISASEDPLFLRLLIDQLVKHLPPLELKAALAEIFINDQTEGLRGGRFEKAYTALSTAREEDVDFYVELLLRHGLIPKPSWVLERLLTTTKDPKTHSKPTEYYGSEVSSLFASLKKEAAGLNTLAEIRAFIDIIYPVDRIEDKKSLPALSGQMIELYRELLERAKKLKLNYQQTADLFELVTRGGGMQPADDFFQEKIWPVLKRDHRGMRSMQKYLGQTADVRNKPRKRIQGSILRQEVAEHLLEPKIAALAAQDEIDERSIQGLLNEIDIYVPDRSLKKDEWLESLSFRLNIQNETDLRNLIESRKLVGATSMTTPMNTHLHSTFSQFVSDMDEDTRLEMIAFMRDPNNYRRGLPHSLVEKIQEQVIAEEYRKAEGKRFRQTITSIARRRTLTTKDDIESALRDTSPLERIVLYEMLLTAGPKALSRQPDHFAKITEQFLNIKPDSLHGKGLQTYVQLFPAEMRTVPLSYLLALSGGSGDIADMIKVFRAVGFQFAQVAPLFKLFDDEHNRQLQKLKDQTMPLSHLEIVQEARKHLSNEDFASIERFERVLASGSIKTVVLVKLKDGRYAVLYLVNPNAEQQIDYNLNLSSEFIAGLKKVGIESSSPLFQLLIDALRDRMKRELRMDIETELTDLARKSVHQFLRENADAVPSGWTVQVSQPEEGTKISRNAALYKYFQGKTLRQWREDIKAGRLTNAAQIAVIKQIEELVFRSAVFDFFRNGIFDPDRHTGNILIDFVGRTISFIDYGKLEDLRQDSHGRDSRVVVAQFLGALDDGNAAGVVDAAVLMTKSGHLSESQKNLVINKVTKALARANGKLDNDVVHEVLAACAAHGIAFEPRYMLGIFKGLLMLFGENYVDQAVGQAIFKKEIVRLYTKNPLDYAGYRFKQMIDRVRHAFAGDESVSPAKCEGFLTR